MGLLSLIKEKPIISGIVTGVLASALMFAFTDYVNRSDLHL